MLSLLFLMILMFFKLFIFCDSFIIEFLIIFYLLL